MQAQNLKPRSFLLKGRETVLRNFAPVKISHHTVNDMNQMRMHGKGSEQEMFTI